MFYNLTMKTKKCIECGEKLTGHGNPKRCRSCSARKNYVDRYGEPPKMLVATCETCGNPIRDYASNHKKSKHGHYFCCEDCRAAWTGVHNSISRGGDAIKRSKSEKDALDYAKHLPKRRSYARKYYGDNRDNILLQKKRIDRALKQEMVGAYGGKCKCCGETIIEFLTIDHINGDGSEHRKRLGKGRKIYADIKAQGFPKDKYRLLCFNCNITLGFYGYCPHHPEIKSNVSHKPFNPGRKRSVK